MRDWRNAKTLAIGAALVILMTLVFRYNFIDPGNILFEDFQSDSSELADGAFFAGAQGLELSHSGLGLVAQLQFGAAQQPGFEQCFDTRGPRIIYARNAYSEKFLLPGHILQLPDSRQLPIVEVAAVDDDDFVVTLAGSGTLINEYNHAIEQHLLLDGEGQPLPFAAMQPYASQYGLHGKLYYHFARLFPGGHDFLLLACSLLTALTLTAISWAIARRYNNLLGCCFYLVFLLSPWVVNFGRNLYWVTFTWFLPMLVGLLCPTNKRRYLFYVLAFLAVFLRCLCGYEYISTILLGLIMFPAIEWLTATGPEKKVHFQNVLFLGIFALLGFAAAILIHALTVNGSDLLAGLYHVFKVAENRTAGMVHSPQQDSLSATISETVAQYFRFDTQIITGLDGNLFVLMIFAAAAIVLYQRCAKTGNTRYHLLFLFSFLLPVSWYILAKGHSFIHTHMNFVLWYFGFVQLCLYFILSFTWTFFLKRTLQE